MRNLLSLVALAALLVSVGCRSKQAKVRAYRAQIDRVIGNCDKLVNTQKPTSINRAIRYYTGYIPKYERLRLPELKLHVARMYARRAQAYGMLGNVRKASADHATAANLGGQAPEATPTEAPDPGIGEAPPVPETAPPPVVAPEGLTPYEGDPIPIAVLPFEAVGSGKDYGKTFAPLLGEDLFNRGRFDLIERAKLDSIMAELKLSYTDLLAKAGTDEAQKLLPVRYLVMGTVTVEGKAVIVTGSFINWKNGKTVVTQKVKRICEKDEVSFYFDEIAHDLGVKLEKDYAGKFPSGPED